MELTINKTHTVITAEEYVNELKATATDKKDGMMAKEDKEKLDGLNPVNAITETELNDILT